MSRRYQKWELDLIARWSQRNLPYRVLANGLNRSRESIKSAKSKSSGGQSSHGVRWSSDEDSLVLSGESPSRVAAITGRTVGAVQSRKRYLQNKDDRRLYQAEYRKRNAERLRQQQHENYVADKQRWVDYRRKNRDHINSQRREYWRVNGEKCRLKQRLYKTKNKESLGEWRREYRKRNLDRFREYDRKSFEKHREARTAQKKEYVARNADKIRARQFSWRQNNAERLRASAREKYLKNRDRCLTWMAAYYKRKQLLERDYINQQGIRKFNESIGG